MAYQNGIITAPVSIYDVQRAIGNSSPDLGTLCTSGNINKWAKYKPEDINTPQVITEQQRVLNNYGIVNIPTWLRLEYMANFIFSTDRANVQRTYWPECDDAAGALSREYFEWKKPTTFKRLSDFSNDAKTLGYYHYAQEPIQPMASPSVVIEPIGTMHITFPMGVATARTLALGDLTYPGSASYPLADMYFGVLMRKTSGTVITLACLKQTNDGYVTMEQALSMGNYTVSVPADVVRADFEGTWKIFPLISSEAFAPTFMPASVGAGKFITPLPDHLQPINVSIRYAEVRIVGSSGYRDTDSARNAIIEVVVQNQEAILRNYNISVKLFDRNGTEMTTFARQRTGQVAASATATETFTIDIRQSWAAMQGGTYQATCTVTDSLKFKKESTDSGTIVDGRPQ